MVALRQVKLAAALALCASAGLPARAAGEEWTLTPSAGYAVAQVQGRARHGACAALALHYGLNDSFGLHGNLHYQGLALPGKEATGLFSRTGLGVGASYVFDVLQVVPYLSVTVGATALGGGALPWRWNAEARLAVGLDWIVRRDFSTGLEIGYGLLVPDFQRFPWALTVSLRLSYRRP